MDTPGGSATARRRDRARTAEGKRSIRHRARAAGVSVAQVGRRYALNANLIHKWLRDPRFAPGLGADAEAAPLEPVHDTGDASVASSVFLPVEVVTEARAGPDDPVVLDEAASTPSGGVIEITLAGGHRLRVEGAYDPDALARLLRGLMGSAS